MMLAGGQQNSAGGGRSTKVLAQGSLNSMRLSRKDTSLVAQVRFLIYSKQPISKSTFGDQYFRALITCNDRPDELTPILSFKSIDKWITAEFEVFKLYLRHELKRKRVQAKGNAFAQGQHDGGTLKDGVKYQVFAFQWISTDFDCNNVVASALSTLDGVGVCDEVDLIPTLEEDEFEENWLDLAYEPILPPRSLPVSHTNANVAQGFVRSIEDMTGLKFTSLIASTIQDGAAGGVADHLALCMPDQETCNMHSASKIGAAAIGQLVRSRKKKVIDPFLAGKELSSRVLGVAKVFSWPKNKDSLNSTASRLENVCKPHHARYVCVRARAYDSNLHAHSLAFAHPPTPTSARLLDCAPASRLRSHQRRRSKCPRTALGSRLATGSFTRCSR